MPCADIDVITRASSAFALAASLGGDILQPVTYATRGGIRGYLGRVVVCSVEVDVLGGLEARGSTGTWSRPPILDRFVHRVAIDGAVFPVVRLSYLVGVYRQFGSAETLERIVRATRSQSATTLLPAADLR